MGGLLAMGARRASWCQMAGRVGKYSGAGDAIQLGQRLRRALAVSGRDKKRDRDSPSCQMSATRVRPNT